MGLFCGSVKHETDWADYQCGQEEQIAYQCNAEQSDDRIGELFWRYKLAEGEYDQACLLYTSPSPRDS